MENSYEEFKNNIGYEEHQKIIKEKMLFTFDDYKKIYPDWLSTQEIIDEYISMAKEYTEFPIIGRAKIAYTFDFNSLNSKLMEFGTISEHFIHFSAFLESFLSNNKKIINEDHLREIIIDGEKQFLTQ